LSCCRFSPSEAARDAAFLLGRDYSSASATLIHASSEKDTSCLIQK
jgi:hypothetical protein